MIIKSFTAESAAAALKKVRSEMGGDAVVLKTRRLPHAQGSNRIEVTACLDKPSATRESRLSSDTETAIPVTHRQGARPTVSLNEVLTSVSTESTSADTGHQLERFERIEKQIMRLAGKIDALGRTSNDLDGFVESIRTRLIDADIPISFVSEFITNLQSTDAKDRTTETVRTALTERISELLGQAPELKAGDSVVFVGPAGSGKTSLLGKLAAQLVGKEKTKVRLLSLDKSGIGAFDEIQSYAAILGLDIGDDEASDRKDRTPSDVITLIDAPALPADDAAREDLIRRIRAIEPTCTIAVFSALTRTSDIQRLAESMAPLSPTHTAVTMLDLTDRHGAMIAAATATNSRLIYTTNAPGGMGSLVTPSASAFVDSIITEEADDE